MNCRAILFDLDDTLIVEQPGAESAFLAAGELARAKHGIDPTALHAAVLTHARALWYNAPTAAFVKRIGASSWEGLWAAFEGNDPDVAALRAWKHDYRRQAWSRGLAEFGIDDAALVDELSAAYGRERRNRLELFPETIEVLESLHGRYRLGVISNGVVDVQHTKMDIAGDLRKYFDAIVVSGEIGIGKPDPRIVEVALERLGVAACDAVLVGNSRRRDIAAAIAAGVRAIWIQRQYVDGESDVTPDASITDLRELEAAIDRMP